MHPGVVRDPAPTATPVENLLVKLEGLIKRNHCDTKWTQVWGEERYNNNVGGIRSGKEDEEKRHTHTRFYFDFYTK